MLPNHRQHNAEETAAQEQNMSAETQKDRSGTNLLPPRYYLRASDVAAVVLLMGVLCLFSLVPLWHTDLWGHLKFGQWIAENAQLPVQEPLSVVADQGTTYIHFQWLAQLVYFLIYRAGASLADGTELRRLEGGATLLQAFHGLMTFLRFAALLIAFRQLTRSMPLACAGIIFVLVFGLSPALIERPQQWGLLFFALVLVPLARPMLSRRALVFIPVLFLLWANCHGSFPVGLVLLGVFLVGRAIDVWRKPDFGSLNAQPKHNRWLAPAFDVQVRRLALVLFLSLAATLLNPHGIFLYSHILQLSRHPNIATMAEWQPLDFTRSAGAHWNYLLLLGLVVTSQVLSWRWPTPTQLLLFVTFALPPLWQQRQLTWWTLIVPCLVLPAWQAIGNRLSWPWLHYQSQPNFKKTVLAIVLVVFFLLWWTPTGWLLSGNPRPLPAALSAATPWQLTWQLRHPDEDAPWELPRLREALQKHYPEGKFTGAVFASETLGDYLLWKLPKDMPVLAFSHAHLFTPDYWQDHMSVLGGQKGWQKILKQRHANLVVIEPLIWQNLAQQLRQSPDWLIVLDESALTQKRDPRTRLLIALRKEPLTIPAAQTRRRDAGWHHALKFVSNSIVYTNSRMAGASITCCGRPV